MVCSAIDVCRFLPNIFEADNYALYALQAYMMTKSNFCISDSKYRWLPQLISVLPNSTATDRLGYLEYSGTPIENGAVQGNLYSGRLWLSQRGDYGLLRNWSDPRVNSVIPPTHLLDLTEQIFLNNSLGRQDYQYPSAYWSYHQTPSL